MARFTFSYKPHEKIPFVFFVCFMVKDRPGIFHGTEWSSDMSRMVLGNTGIEAERLGFGGIPIQRVSESEAIEVVLYALEKGMDFIDTSRMYTTSETRIGKALKQSAKKAAVATKSFNRSADGIQRDVEKSLKELQLDYIDLYQCHGISNDEEYRLVTSKDGALSGLLKAKEQGLIGHIGITGHSIDLLEKVVDDGLFETIMICLSFLEPAAMERLIPKAREKHIGMIAMKPFSGGVIEAPEVALKWVLSVPDVLVLAGVEAKKLIDQNWSIFQGSYELTAAELKEIQAISKEFEKIFCRRCDYCLPCSAEIPIQFVLGVRSLVKRAGPGIIKTPMFAKMAEQAGKCTECGDCMERCPYDLPIPDIIKENLQWMKGLA
jgi:predicted aldo/keto reductase-like oxidoreductase